MARSRERTDGRLDGAPRRRRRPRALTNAGPVGAVAAALGRAARAAVAAAVGRPVALAPHVLARYPELAAVRWRAGGLPPRVGGWCLGQPTVAGITLWGTVFLADPARASEHLLLHELAHVHQFRRVRGFPVRYCWESLRRGYRRNRFEREADAYADRLVADRAGRAAPPP